MKKTGWIVLLVVAVVAIGFFVIVKNKSPETAAPSADAENAGGKSATAPAKPSTGAAAEATGGSRPAPAPAATTAAPSPAADLGWNRSDPDAFANGNLKIAGDYLRRGGSAEGSARPDAAAALKTPASYYGQVLCFSGTVAANEDAGTAAARLLKSDATSEVILRHPDGSMLDYFLVDDTGDQKVGEQRTLCGLPVGVTAIADGTGGKVSQLVLVGRNTSTD